jgi:hypothetical protein
MGDHSIMTISIEQKRHKIDAYIATHPSEGHPHYWCGGNETDCDSCNMDHPMTDLQLSMLEEERNLFQEIR